MSADNMVGRTVAGYHLAKYIGEGGTATVYRADGSARLLRERDSLEGEDVLPGFTFRLSELYD